ncbi:hypothetical protein [Carboxylicivirga caseinilyticus]|uniref:hypothetical protein n=1 Tax=Carboxylicivirga caseinilyticus TaxID=3417572 RepID=UPI003D356C71|nr:hypothetical protein [Marinilabiliaceae bacterium A049]
MKALVKWTMGVLLSFMMVLSTSANNPESNSKAYEMPFAIDFYCMCAGEQLVGTVVFQVVENGNAAHFSVKQSDVYGLVSGKRYHFVRVENYVKIGQIILMRVVGEEGIVTNLQWVSMNGNFRPPCE